MPTQDRPLSPHLQIYQPQLTWTMSISHRLTGIALAVGTLLLVYWLIAAAQGPEAFATAQALVGSWIGRLLLFGWTIALFYHLANGIRHLVWDTGLWLDLPSVYASGRGVLIATALLTIVTWIAGYWFRGGA
ncbi:succinate dehydrogenase, cytochrome b556 subunit [Rhodospirillaceae bacterium SYSU D60014]|uniref:succinate dehydrogenase, cytochrome b556 subunit n=1 Tax=Virgifigura deserti TaxID=2268457 RepID=UPI000E66ECDE